MYRFYFEKSKTACGLEYELQTKCGLKLVEHKYLSSTGNTDVENNIINLDISQEPLKTALTYAYELKNFQNRLYYSVPGHSFSTSLLPIDSEQSPRARYFLFLPITRMSSLKREPQNFRDGPPQSILLTSKPSC